MPAKVKATALNSRRKPVPSRQHQDSDDDDDDGDEKTPRRATLRLKSDIHLPARYRNDDPTSGEESGNATDTSDDIDAETSSPPTKKTRTMPAHRATGAKNHPSPSQQPTTTPAVVPEQLSPDQPSAPAPVDPENEKYPWRPVPATRPLTDHERSVLAKIPLTAPSYRNVQAVNSYLNLEDDEGLSRARRAAIAINELNGSFVREVPRRR